MMPWWVSWRADPAGARLADRHYPRRSVGASQFVPPGRCVVLRADGAVWVTSWQEPEYVKHGFGDVWVCSLFRNERPDEFLSSDLIVAASAATRAVFGEPPTGGFITFVDPSKVRRKRDPGRCFIRAGWHRLARRTKDRGLIVFHLPADECPPAVEPVGFQLAMVA